MVKINEDVNELIKFSSSAEAKELTKKIEKENALRIQQTALFVIIKNIMLSNNVSEEKAKEIVFEQSLSIENKLRKKGLSETEIAGITLQELLKINSGI